VFDVRRFKGYPAAENGGFDQMNVGGGPVGTPDTAGDLHRFGINLLALANNHSTDYGLEGQAETERVLREASMFFAGSGRNRAEARAAAFLETQRDGYRSFPRHRLFVRWAWQVLAAASCRHGPASASFVPRL
jgi:poly-gamma-glutamate synthesis protein (capsule biosynthesis protein)